MVTSDIDSSLQYLSIMLLQVKDIFKSYNMGLPNERIILENLSLELKAGERVAIAGPSGSGKTTLLNILGTLDKPDEGQILYKDKDLNLLDEEELNAFRNREIGFVFQQHHLLPQCNDSVCF